MRKQDWPKFRELMAHAANLTAMPNGKNIENVAASYFAELERYPLEAVAGAVRGYCRANRFFPALADIVTAIEGPEEDRAALAWASVLRAMSRWGYYDSVRFPDPAIHYAIAQMGGWMHLCATLRNDTEPFRRKDFAGYYATGRRLGAGAKPAPYLMGAHEADGRTRGFAAARCVYDTGTGRRVPESELPALAGGGAPLARLLAQSARAMRAEDVS